MPFTNPALIDLFQLSKQFAEQAQRGATCAFLIIKLRQKYARLSTSEKLEIYAKIERIDAYEDDHPLANLPDDIKLRACEYIIEESDEREHTLTIQQLNQLTIADPVAYAKLQELKGTTLFFDIAELDDPVPSHPSPSGPI